MLSSHHLSRPRPPLRSPPSAAPPARRGWKPRHRQATPASRRPPTQAASCRRTPARPTRPAVPAPAPPRTGWPPASEEGGERKAPSPPPAHTASRRRPPGWPRGRRERTRGRARKQTRRSHPLASLPSLFSAAGPRPGIAGSGTRQQSRGRGRPELLPGARAGAEEVEGRAREGRPAALRLPLPHHFPRQTTGAAVSGALPPPRRLPRPSPQCRPLLGRPNERRTSKTRPSPGRAGRRRRRCRRRRGRGGTRPRARR